MSRSCHRYVEREQCKAEKAYFFLSCITLIYTFQWINVIVSHHFRYLKQQCVLKMKFYHGLQEFGVH